MRKVQLLERLAYKAYRASVTQKEKNLSLSYCEEIDGISKL